MSDEPENQLGPLTPWVEKLIREVMDDLLREEGRDPEEIAALLKVRRTLLRERDTGVLH